MDNVAGSLYGCGIEQYPYVGFSAGAHQQVISHVPGCLDLDAEEMFGDLRDVIREGL